MGSFLTVALTISTIILEDLSLILLSDGHSSFGLKTSAVLQCRTLISLLFLLDPYCLSICLDGMHPFVKHTVFSPSLQHRRKMIVENSKVPVMVLHCVPQQC